MAEVDGNPAAVYKITVLNTTFAPAWRLECIVGWGDESSHSIIIIMSFSLRSPLLLALLALSSCSIPVVYAQNTSLTTVEWRTGNAKVDSLIEQLTPEEKISLVHGASDPGNKQQAGYVVPIPRLGIPAVRLSDGEA